MPIGDRNKQLGESAQSITKSYADYSRNLEFTAPPVQETVSDLLKDEEFQANAEIYMNWLATDEAATNKLVAGNVYNPDIAEVMRDETFSLSSLIERSKALENAPEEVLQAYKHVKTRWTDSKLDGAANWLSATRDGLVDIFTDPVELAALLAIPFTSGGSAVGVQAAKEAGKVTLRKAIQNTLAKVGSAAKSPAGITALEGAAWSGMDNYYNQNAEIAADMRDEFSRGEFAFSTGIGAGVGGALGAFVPWAGKNLMNYFTSGTSKGATREANAITESNLFNKEIENMPEERNFPDPLEDQIDMFPITPKERSILELDVPEEQPTIPTEQLDLIEPEQLNMFPQFDQVRQTIKNNLEADDVDIDSFAAQLSNDLEGGDATKEEITDLLTGIINQYRKGGVEEVDDVVSVPTSTNTTKSTNGISIGQRIFFEVSRLGNKLNSSVGVGRATGILNDFADKSPTAQRLQNLFRYDSELGWTGSKLDVDETIGQDFNEVFNSRFGKFVTDFHTIFVPVTSAKGKLKEDLNILITQALRGVELPENLNPAIQTIVTDLRSLLKSRADELGLEVEEGVNYVPRMWKRSVIENNEGRFKQLLTEAGYTENQANDIVDGMLSKNTEYLISNNAANDTLFLRPRVLDKITDDSIFADFLENDLTTVMVEYGSQTARKIAKQEVLGVANEAQFKTKWVEPIARELKEAGLSDRDIINFNRDVKEIYNLTTGENVARFKPGGKTQTTVDAWTFLTRTATLPLATLSSLTEVFINVSKAGTINSVKGLGSALKDGFNTITVKAFNKLKDDHNLTEPEAWRILNEMGIAMDQSIADVSDRLGGSEINNGFFRKANNAFFRLNMLDQWTKFVQLTSFHTGRNLILDNIEQIAAHAGVKQSKRILEKRRTLSEMGINVDDAVNWFVSGRDKNSSFMDEINKGAGRYVNEVILNPSASANLKPTLHANPRTSFLFQLMGYPAAFTNTILKNTARKLVENPLGNTANVAFAGLLMTETARALNYFRSRGKSEEDGETQARLKAIMRFGGAGAYLDMMNRLSKRRGGLEDYFTLPFGPVVHDTINAYRYSAPIETLGTKLPGYGAMELIFGEEFRDDYQQWLRNRDDAVLEFNKDVRDEINDKNRTSI